MKEWKEINDERNGYRTKKRIWMTTYKVFEVEPVDLAGSKKVCLFSLVKADRSIYSSPKNKNGPYYIGKWFYIHYVFLVDCLFVKNKPYDNATYRSNEMATKVKTLAATVTLAIKLLTVQ